MQEVSELEKKLLIIARNFLQELEPNRPHALTLTAQPLALHAPL